MKKYLILCLILVATLTSVNAQDKGSDKAEKVDAVCCEAATVFAPQKGDFTAAMIFGRGAYLNGGLVVPSSNSAVPGDAPYANDISANSNSITNMVGAEGRYYIKDNFAISFSGGAILRNTPEQLAIPSASASVPAYSAVVANERINAMASIGGQWLFKTKNDRLFPYVGFALPFDYARQSNFQQIDENLDIVDLGARHTEIMAFGIQAVAGVDYYIAKDVFFGFDIKPVSYSYAFSTKTPGPGLLNLEADTTTVSFFAQFSFKLGFKF